MTEPFFSLTDLGLSSSASALVNTWLQAMQTQFPGYSPSAASLEYVQAQIFAAFVADVASLASNGASELFKTFGTELVGIPVQQGVTAQAVVTATADTSPGTIATTSGGLNTGGPIVSIPVIALPFGIAAGTITITDSTLANTQDWTTSGANAGDTSISVSSQTPNFAYSTGSTIAGTQLYIIPVLSQFDLDSLGFINLTEVDIAAGQSANITLTAVQTGTIFNGAGSGGAVQPIQQFSWLTTLTLYSPAAGGLDPEDDSHYLNRLKGALQLQAPRPITASDYASMALNFTPYPGTDQQLVGRATAIDGYNPADGTFNNERMVTVATPDSNGFALNNDTLYGFPNGTSSNVITTIPSPNSGWGVEGWLQSLREINFIVNIIQPTYTPVYVTVTVVAATGWDATSVKQGVQGALLSYLTPQAWGLPPPNINGWENVSKIFQSRLMQIVQTSRGVDHVVNETLAFGFSAGPSNLDDLVLSGPIPLPTSSALTIPLTAITVM